jgi:hypothetical protein
MLSRELPKGYKESESIGIVTSSLLVGWRLNSFCREAAGSGIRRLKLAFGKEFGTVPATAERASATGKVDGVVV